MLFDAAALLDDLLLFEALLEDLLLFDATALFEDLAAEALFEDLLAFSDAEGGSTAGSVGEVTGARVGDLVEVLVGDGVGRRVEREVGDLVGEGVVCGSGIVWGAPVGKTGVGAAVSGAMVCLYNVKSTS